MHLALLSLPSNPHCRKWAQALARAGAQVTVYSFERGEIPGVRCVQLRADLRWRGRYRYPSYLLAGRRLRRSLRADGVDVLHPLHLTPFGLWAEASGFRPVIGAAIGADVLDYVPLRALDPLAAAGYAQVRWDEALAPRNPLAKARQALLRRMFARGVRRAVACSAALTADNQTLVEGLRWLGAPAERIHLLRWGVDTAELDQPQPELVQTWRNKLDLAPGARLLLAPRGLLPIYQPVWVLASAALLHQRGVLQPQDRLLLLDAGYGCPPDLQAQLSAWKQAVPQLHVNLGLLDRPNMAALWRLADILINVPVYDGYSAALAEARYLGALPVVNDIPAHRELLTEGLNATFAQAHRPEALAQALQQALFLPESERAEWAARNRQWVDANSRVETAAEEFLALAQQVLHSHRQPGV